MKENIIALVFGILALVLEVFLSIKNPTVESIVAAAFAAVIVVAVAISIFKSPKVVTLTEELPNGKRPVDKVLKLANEIAPYVKEKDGIISVKIIK